jgi:crossover junction endodeoxyribonuclease RuvC
VTARIGIDPGKEGALALFLDGELLDVVDMPIAGGVVSAALLVAELEDFARAAGSRPTVYLEKVHAMPKQGVASSFGFGRSLGVVEGVVAALGWPLVWVAPQEWKKRHGLLRQDKDAARLLAIETWPDHVETFRLKKHLDRAEAALIGTP